MPEYQATLQELSQVVCHTVEHQIHDLVFRRKLIKGAKAFESGKNANKLLKRMERLRGCACFVLWPVGVPTQQIWCPGHRLAAGIPAPPQVTSTLMAPNNCVHA